MSVKSAFSVRRALSSAVGFVPQALAGAWLILSVMWLTTLASPFSMVPHSVPALGRYALFAVSILLKVVALGALYRLALFGPHARAEGLGPGGVQFGWPEIRLVMANLAIFMFICLIFVVMLTVFFIALSLGGFDASLKGVIGLFTHPTGAAWIYIVYALVAYIFLIFVALKFTLAHAATIAQRRLVALNALGLSSGNVGKLCLGLVVIFVPFTLATVAVTKILGLQGVFLTPLVSGAASPLGWALHAAIGALAVALILPLSVGFLASAYGQIVAIRVK